MRTAERPAPKLSELLREFVEANPSQLEKGQTVEQWVRSTYKTGGFRSVKLLAVELLRQFDGDPNPAAAEICALLRPLTE